MESLLQEVAEGSARGIRRWYAVAHAARCQRCGTFLQRMQFTIEALHRTKEAPQDEVVLDRLRSKLAAIEGNEIA